MWLCDSVFGVVVLGPGIKFLKNLLIELYFMIFFIYSVSY
jgi:hypothetical protein